MSKEFMLQHSERVKDNGSTENTTICRINNSIIEAEKINAIKESINTEETL